jgi:DNA (cytosine-5)-methyltransferase 1
MFSRGIGYLIPFQGRLDVFYSGMAKEPPTFIDLFAGIGGFHEAFHGLGAECVMACERDKHARISYQAFHQKKVVEPEQFFSECKDDDKGVWRFPRDITKVTKTHGKDDKLNDEKMVESIDHIKYRTQKFALLCAGFPCQPFSHAGKRLGFDDARGTLFYDVALILKARTPGAFFLENVRGLIRHGYNEHEPVTLNGEELKGIGSTLGRILNVLFSTNPGIGLGYYYPEVDKNDPRYIAPGVFLVRASDHSLPQYRPRIFIIGFKHKSDAARFKMPEPERLPKSSLATKLKVHEVFMDKKGTRPRTVGFTLRCGGKQSPITAKQNWDSYYVVREEGGDVDTMRIEWKQGLKLQGFPGRQSLPDGVSPGQMMKQLGNSVAVPAIKAWGQQLLLALGHEQ